MFKIKKTILIILLASPILTALMFGYPVKTFKEELKGGLVYTKRCFKVGEWEQFLNCFSQKKTIKGAVLLSEFQHKASSLFPHFDLIFYGAVGLSLVVLLFI